MGAEFPTSPGGGGAASFVLRPGDPNPGPNVFLTMAALVAARNGAQAQHVHFDDRYGNIWIEEDYGTLFRGDVWHGRDQTAVRFRDPGQASDMPAVIRNLRIVATGPTLPAFVLYGAGGEDDRYQLEHALLQASGAPACVVVGHAEATANKWLLLSEAAQVFAGAVDIREGSAVQCHLSGGAAAVGGAFMNIAGPPLSSFVTMYVDADAPTFEEHFDVVTDFLYRGKALRRYPLQPFTGDFQAQRFALVDFTPPIAPATLTLKAPFGPAEGDRWAIKQVNSDAVNVVTIQYLTSAIESAPGVSASSFVLPGSSGQYREWVYLAGLWRIAASLG